ncbi:MAG TPA: alpha-galactosidase [Candidatus Methylacidiphilales bacterium]
METISFNAEKRLFVLRLESSFYAMRILESGELVHVGWGPLPELDEDVPLNFQGLENFQDHAFPWDNQTHPYEFPAAGDVLYHDTAIRANFAEPARPLEKGEAFHGSVRDLRLRYAGHEVRTEAEPALAPRHGLPVRIEAKRSVLAIHLKDAAYAFAVTLFYRVTPEHDILERWVEVRNETGQPVKLDRLDFGCAHLPAHATKLTYAAGHWGREFVAETLELKQGSFVLEQFGLNTGHAHNPFFLIHASGEATENAGTVWFGALAFSGNWNLRFEQQQNHQINIFGGYGLADFEIILQPGEAHRTPAMMLGCSREGIGGASRRSHRFVRERVLPDCRPDEFRPVLYNSWEATYFDVSEKNQMELARLAASLGVELFCMDDGWFGARKDDKASLGDWSPRPEAFPHGIKPLSDEVHRLGMQFGLWVEPEMINPDSDLYRAHPDWVLHYPARPRSESRNQLILDFGRPEVVEYIFQILDQLVRDNGIDFFKWDMNRYVSEPGSQAGRGIWRKHVESLYSIMDRLRKQHPHLRIQSCSGGGGRIDLGILTRCDQAWASDNTDAVDRTRIQDGFSLIYPARAMECWVTHEKNHQTGRISSLDLRFDVAMRGVLGIGTPLKQLSEEELARYRRKIAFYKRIRPTVQEGDLYRLSVAAKEGISAWLFVAPDRSTAVFSISVIEHLYGTFYFPTVLRGLDPRAIYRLLDEHEKEVARYGGLQLMTLGLPGEFAFSDLSCFIRSGTLLLERVD